MNEGWIKVYRSLLDHPRFDDGDWLKVWLFLLCRATHTAYRVVFEGKDTELKPGQLITSRQSIVEFCRVERSKVERILKTLETEHQIEQRSCTTCRLVTILNWEKFQKSEQPYEQHVSSDRATSEQRVSTHKKVQKGQNGQTATPWPGDEVVNSWNATALPECRTITPKRKAQLHARLKSSFFLQHWVEALGAISKSSFCLGGGDTGWVASFDWFIKNDDAVAKAIEGQYNNRSAPPIRVGAGSALRNGQQLESAAEAL
jgi:DNA-binding transcriptional MocR family regulator